MPALTIKAPAYAYSLGITPRSLVRFIVDERMPGARKVRSVWRITPSKAEPWLRENHPKLFADEPLALPTNPEKGRDDSIGETDDDSIGETDLELADIHIRRLNKSLTSMVTVLSEGTYNRNLVHSIKQVSGELRLLEKHRLDMRRANAELMTRHEHRHVMATLAQIIATEIDGHGHSIPEDLLGALTTAGCTISKPKTALKAATRAAHEQAEQLRHRIADAIEKSTIGDP